MAPVSIDTITADVPISHEKRPASSPPASPPPAQQAKKQQAQRKKQPKVKRRKYKAKKDLEPTSPLGVLQHEIDQLIHELGLSHDAFLNPINELLNDELDIALYHRTVPDVTVLKFTSNGDSLALVANPEHDNKRQIVVVPFGIPGDVVTVKIYKTHPTYVESDLLSIETAASIRDDSLINCRYFGACSGCQYQSLTYATQLELKKEVIANAYKFFAPVLTAARAVPQISDTESSPLQYDYRTKLTPHFDMPRRRDESAMKRPNLGFGSKGRPEWRDIPEESKGNILDIEECVIGTSVINRGMALERQKFMQNYRDYNKGATILLRENTEFNENSSALVGELDSETNEVMIMKDATLSKTYVNKPRQIVKEIIRDYQFEFSAGEFFQNNNSILPKVVDYVSDNLQLESSRENYLIDAYCGSGLFSITCSKSVVKTIGVEISADSVKFAKRNASLNNIQNCEFLVGKAEEIFKDITLPSDKTSIILDPPRKGCDDVFLKQLSAFNPVKIIYISCNVHSQARDIEFFLNHTEKGSQYKIDSIKGFDFFPQTHHVESVAVLSLIQ